MILRKIKTALAFNNSNFSRAFDRYACRVSADLHFMEHGFNIEGNIVEISQGGVLFRPSQTYVVRRSSGMTRIICGDFQIEAEIRNTSDHGYGLRFRHVIPESQVALFLASADAYRKTAQ